MNGPAVPPLVPPLAGSDRKGGPAPRWPTWIAYGGAAFGAIGAMRVNAAIDADARVVIVVLVVWLQMGGAIAAALMLVGTGFGRLGGGTPAIGASIAPRWIVQCVGGTAVVAAVVVTTYTVDPRFVVTGVIGAALVAVARRGWPGPWRAGPAALALVAAVALVEVPRELGWSSVTWQQAETRLAGGGNSTHRGTCPVGNRTWALANGATGYEVVPRLDGNVGALVRTVEGGTLENRVLLEVHGNVETGWATCFMPLFKSFHVAYSVDYTGTLQGTGGSVICTLSGSWQGTRISGEMNGIESCRNLRKFLARRIERDLAGFATSLVHR